MPNPTELNEKPRPKPQLNPQQEPMMHQGGGHHNPRQHTMESVQGQQGMTAEQLRRQIEQAVEAKLENRGVNQTVDNMNRMMTRPNQEFSQQQQLASAAVAAATKAHMNDDIMRDGTAKTFAKAANGSKTLGDEAFIKPLTRQSVDFGIENDTNTKSTGKKILSSQPRAEKPMSHDTLHTSVSNKMAQEEASDVVQLGTSETEVKVSPQVDNPVADIEVEPPISEVNTPSSAGKINVFFVPNLGDESEISGDDINLSHIAIGGESKQIVSSKFRPVVYLKNEDATGYNAIEIPGVKVKEGYTQIDAFDYARKNHAELKDIAENNDFTKMAHHAFETPNPECRISAAKYASGKDINPYAISEKDAIINVPSIANGHETFNAYEYELAANKSGANVLSVDKVLHNAYLTSLDEDRIANPDIYRDADAFHKRCVDKGEIISDKTIDNATKKERLKQLDADFANSQKQYYADKGLDEASIEHLEKLGYIGVDSVRFKTQVAMSHDLAQSMKNINSENHKIIDGAGKFTVSSDSKDTNFGGYLMQHKNDIIGYIGDKLGISDEEARKHKLHISTPSISQCVSTCVVMYEGFEGQNVDDTVREVVNDMLKEYGDKHARISDKSYAVEKNEIDYCNFKYGNTTAQYAVPTYGSVVERSVPQESQVTLNSELDAGFDAAQQDYYDKMAQGMDM